jgi:hypothetical protein
VIPTKPKCPARRRRLVPGGYQVAVALFPFVLAMLMVATLVAASANAAAAPSAGGAPVFSSSDHATFTIGSAGTFTVVASGAPAPTITETGPLPVGLGFDPATDTLTGTPSLQGAGRSGLFPITLTAANGAGTATQTFTLTVDQAPSLNTNDNQIFTVGFQQSIYFRGVGFPIPSVTEAGALPQGLTFSYRIFDGGGAIQGTPAPGSPGTYHLTFTSTNGIGPPVIQTLDVTVQAGGLTYPTNGQVNVDTTMPFTWQGLSDGVAYRLLIGTTPGGANLLDSGVFTPNLHNYPYYLPNALPVGQVLYATLSVERIDTWVLYQTVAFTAAPGLAVFTFPINGQTNVANNNPFSWTAVPGADGYYLAVGTHLNATDVFNSLGLPASQTSYTPARALPAGVTLYAELLTCVHLQCTRYQAISFTAVPGGATFLYPTDGQIAVDTTRAFAWSPVPQAQAYYLLIGTSPYGADVVNSGRLPATTSTYLLPSVPAPDVQVFATLFTEVAGTWSRYQEISFTTNPGMSYFTNPTNGATNTAADTYDWTYSPGLAQGFYLMVGTTPFGEDVINSGVLTVYPRYTVVGRVFPVHTKLYATLITEIAGTWTRYDAISFTTP